MNAADLVPEVLKYLPPDADAGLVLDDIIDTLIDIYKRSGYYRHDITHSCCEPDELICDTVFYEGHRYALTLPTREHCYVPAEFYNVWLELVVFGTLARTMSKLFLAYADLKTASYWEQKFNIEYNKFLYNRLTTQGDSDERVQSSCACM